MDRNNTEFSLHRRSSAISVTCASELLEIEGIYPDEMEESLKALDPSADAWQIATQNSSFGLRSAGRWLVVHPFPLVATIASHDSAQEFNLIQNRWQSSYAAFSL
ncbi:MAG: hypothetical protein R3F04_13230 [Lysobacteraceae bacterium]